MSLFQTSDDAVGQERQTQQDIFNAIDEYQNIVFNAGAGAGKTYALIESLKYIIEKKGENLTYHNQKVICITYTNVATNEIKERLGNTRLIKVSTIHERLWDLVKGYQKQLVGIHTDKLNEDLIELNHDLDTEDKFQAYRDLIDKDFFINLMLENKDSYYLIRNKGAAEFRALMQTFLENHNDLLRNVSNFKSLVGKIFKIDNYNSCLRRIEEKEYTRVAYDARYNSDRLHKMTISHDTLLEYAYKIVNQYDVVKQIILDQFPYILVDEYQDTDEKVVQLLSLLSNHSEHIKHNLFIGYFGDTAQKIYDTGVGGRLLELHANLENIYKNHNRRSVNEVLSVINKIRNDEIQQESIFSDATGGSVEFYQGNEANIDSFITHYKEEWGIDKNNRLHCLVLTNELVAKYNKFENIYQKFKATPYFKANWQSINTEILSHDLSKLGIIPNLLYRLVDFKTKLENPKTSITKFVSDEIYKSLTLNQLKELLEIMKSLSGITLKDFLVSMFSVYEETSNHNYKQIIKHLIELDEYSFDGLVSFILNKLFLNIRDDEIDSSKDQITDLLDIDYCEYSAWFDFINKVENQDVIYHTYHGTKGEEYNNVIILMQNNFGPRGRNKFSSFFTKEGKANELEGEELEKFTDTKNLLYVSCSRAISNLRIFYLDDVSDFEGGISAIFGKIQEYQV